MYKRWHVGVSSAQRGRFRGGTSQRKQWIKWPGIGFKSFDYFSKHPLKVNIPTSQPPSKSHPLDTFATTSMRAFVSPLRHFGIKFILYEFMGQKLSLVSCKFLWPLEVGESKEKKNIRGMGESGRKCQNVG